MTLCSRSDGHDLLLLLFHCSINVLDILVGQLLDILFHGLLAVLGQLAGLLHCLGLVHCLAADVAHGDLCILTQLGDLLGQLLAALLGGSREVQTDGLAVINGVDADVAGLDRLGDGLEHRAVPRGDGQDAGLGHGHSSDLSDLNFLL